MKDVYFNKCNIESQKQDVVAAFGSEGALLNSGEYIDLIFTSNLGFKNVYL
jgi:hypothetical protein